MAKETSFQNDEIKPLFPRTFGVGKGKLEPSDKKNSPALRIGVVFSGGPAPGGHNVVSGLFDALQHLNPASRVIGYENGAAGLLKDEARELTSGEIDFYRNTGGFDLLGTGRTKIETTEQMEAALKSAVKWQLDGLVIVGGDDSNTNGALLAEYAAGKGQKLCVIGVPKTIDGDLACHEIPVPFGFDTACKTYSEMIGNIGKDALSSKKYVHFIKLMGRSASHIALECALQTQPNLVLIGEERRSLTQIVGEIVQVLEMRRSLGKSYGVFLIPEGILEFMPEVGTLIRKINTLLGQGIRPEEVPSELDAETKAVFELLPKMIQEQLLLERDAHGNVQVSQIETENLLISLVKQRAEKFSFQPHFFGYEGRCAFPTHFDSNYCYALGAGAALAVRDCLTCVIISIPNLKEPLENWRVEATPLVRLFHLEMRKGKQVPVIRKALVDLQGMPYKTYLQRKSAWKVEDRYRSPGPIQFFGDPRLIYETPLCLL